MEVELSKRTQTWGVRVGAGFLILELLMSVIDIHTAEKAAVGQGWYLKTAIIGPWLSCLALGFAIIKSLKRDQINEELAGTLLICIGFVVMMSYDSISELSKLIR